MRTFSNLFAAMLLVALFAIPVAFARRGAPAASNAPASVMAEDEDQPHMQAALEALKQAENHLNQATHDKGGHRAAALKSTRDAIHHVEAGMKAGDKHEDKHEHEKK